jgi:hypothetical protein
MKIEDSLSQGASKCRQHSECKSPLQQSVSVKEDACLTDLVKVHRPGLNSLAVFVEEGAGTFRGGESEDWCLLSVLQLPLVCDIAGSAAHSLHQDL